MKQQARPFHVAEKADAKPRAFVRAFNQAGQVSDNVRAADFASLAAMAAIRIDHTEIGLERRKGIVRDFRPRRGDDRNQRRLPGIWEADEADIGEQSELEA